jgi:hypothetical protein
VEDIVAIKATDSRGKRHFFVTWGRVFDSVDPQPLLNAIRPALPRFGLSTIRRLEVCSTLQEASEQPYFFEALLAFSQKRIPSGKARRAWSALVASRLQLGKTFIILACQSPNQLLQLTAGRCGPRLNDDL